MRLPIVRRVLVRPALYLAIAYSACGVRDSSNHALARNDSVASGSVHGASGAEVRAAIDRLRAYLSSALVTNAQNREDTVYSCVPDYVAQSRYALARFRILGAIQQGDTIRATAEIVSVAQESDAATSRVHYVTHVGVRTDTLHWALTRASPSGSWGVCGYAAEDVDFRILGKDAQTTWQPPGASWASIKRTARSIQDGWQP